MCCEVPPYTPPSPLYRVEPFFYSLHSSSQPMPQRVSPHVTSSNVHLKSCHYRHHQCLTSAAYVLAKHSVDLYFLMIRRHRISTLFPHTTPFLFFLKNTAPTEIYPFSPQAVFPF